MAGRSRAHLLEEVDAPLEMVDYFEAFADDEYAFFLDSAMDPERLGRYSFLGRRPFAVFECKRDRFAIHREGGVTRGRGDPLEALRALAGEFRVEPSLYRGSPIPFLGGAVGYLGYGIATCIEGCLPDRAEDDLGLPDACFLFVDAVAIRDHREDRTWVSALGFGPDPAAARERARKACDGMRADLRHRELRGPRREARARGERRRELALRARLGKREYLAMVERAKRRIAAGQAYQICTTQRLECDFSADPFQLYRDLRSLNPAPFASYLSLPGVKIVSASPERFLRLGRDGWAESRPIKGTRPRGASAARDRALHRELVSSAKERAENLMIVDLVRNDLGRVCETGSIQVPELMTVERYATVFHLVSTIVGRLAAGRDVFDLLRACFPGGSMTGAPKIEAMATLDALEPVARGIYAGAIGYLDGAGNADFSIVIRTILVRGGKAYLQVGGAVVADSEPEAEYRESLDKARALVRALRRTELGTPDVETPPELGALGAD